MTSQPTVKRKYRRSNQTGKKTDKPRVRGATKKRAPENILPANLSEFIVDNEATNPSVTEEQYMECLEVLSSDLCRKTQISRIQQILGLESSQSKEAQPRQCVPTAQKTAPNDKSQQVKPDKEQENAAKPAEKSTENASDASGLKKDESVTERELPKCRLSNTETTKQEYSSTVIATKRDLREVESHGHASSLEHLDKTAVTLSNVIDLDMARNATRSLETKFVVTYY